MELTTLFPQFPPTPAARGHRPAARAADDGEQRQTVTTTVAAPAKSSGARIAVQKVGTFLSGMIMPNIAAFIAWGFITAFFIQTGWTPVPGLGGFGVDSTGAPNVGLVGPMIRFMLPLLIAMQGGRMVYGVRGGVVAVVATMGVIVSTEQPMF